MPALAAWLLGEVSSQKKLVGADGTVAHAGLVVKLTHGLLGIGLLGTNGPLGGGGFCPRWC